MHLHLIGAHNVDLPSNGGVVQYQNHVRITRVHDDVALLTANAVGSGLRDGFAVVDSGRRDVRGILHQLWGFNFGLHNVLGRGAAALFVSYGACCCSVMCRNRCGTAGVQGRTIIGVRARG